MSAPASSTPHLPPGMADGHHPTVVGYVTNEHIARHYDRTFGTMALFVTDTRFLEEILPAPPARIVDLGCGTGRHVVHLAARGYDVTGVDLSEHMLTEVRSKLASEGASAELVRADICDMSELRGGSFDGAVCMFSTLGLLGTRDLRLAAVREAARLLSPGGVFAFHVHNMLYNLTHRDGRRWLLRNALDAIRGRAGLGDRMMSRYRGELDLYLHLFTRREAVGLVRDAGLELIRVMALNESRSGEVTGLRASVRANGFLFAAKKV